MKKLLVAALGAASTLIAAAPAGANAAFDFYIAGLESRLARQHGSPDCFLAGANQLTGDDPLLERVAARDFPGALLHHWRGTAVARGARAVDFDRLLRDFRSYPRVFGPEVMKTAVRREEEDEAQIWMRVRQHHVITVTIDAAYDVTFGRRDARRGFSASKSTRISEIESPGTSAERALDGDQEHGFLWRLNTYWTYEERGGGLYLQVEAVSLTRSIPRGLGWAIRPWVERVPRESLEFTLRAARAALPSQKDTQ